MTLIFNFQINWRQQDRWHGKEYIINDYILLGVDLLAPHAMVMVSTRSGSGPKTLSTLTTGEEFMGFQVLELPRLPQQNWNIYQLMDNKLEKDTAI